MKYIPQIALIVAGLALVVSGVALGLAFDPPPMGAAPIPAALGGCPSLELLAVVQEGPDQVVRLRARWPGPGQVALDVGAFALVDAEGRSYAARGNAATIPPGGYIPVELYATPAGADLAEVRLEVPGCLPVVVELAEGGRP